MRRPRLRACKDGRTALAYKAEHAGDPETGTIVAVTTHGEGGCFVEMPTLPPDQGQLKITIWADNAKVTMRGVVASRRPGFGISIKFTEMTEEVRQQLPRFIQSLVVRGE
jgi:hypothetical protein